jgi:nickel transport protein
MRPDPIHLGLRFKALLIGMAFLGTAVSAWAHGLSVFAWVEGGRVMVESKFSGGKRPVDATVRVLDLDGRELLTGKTDDQGRWAFDPPRKTALKIVLEAGLGHRGEWTLRAEDMGALPEVAEVPAAAPQARPAPQAVDTATAELDARLKAIVTEALEPMSARLARLEQSSQGPGLRDILGGLGYILGLVGVGAYVQARRIRDGDGAGAAPGPTP